MMKQFIFICLICLLVVPAKIYAGDFSANCTDGVVHVSKCKLNGGYVLAPPWYSNGSLWRIGPAMTVSFKLSGPIPNQLVLKVRHTGSWGNNEFTLGSVKVNGNTIISGYVPPDHMNDPDTFSIPRTYLREGENTIEFSLSGGNYVWWIRSIEANW
jgi:hypothetical protein